MLPVSGAEQLKTSEANTTRPICSLRKAYSCAPMPVRSGPFQSGLQPQKGFAVHRLELAAPLQHAGGQIRPATPVNAGIALAGQVAQRSERTETVMLSHTRRDSNIMQAPLPRC